MELINIQKLPIGYSEVVYRERKYGVSRTDFNNGKSIKLFARELGGNDFISFNFYITENGESLKPCEMSDDKVRHFLKNYSLLQP